MTNIVKFENLYKIKLSDGYRCLIFDNFIIKLYPDGFYAQEFPTVLISNKNCYKPFNILYNNIIESSIENSDNHCIQINHFYQNDYFEIL